MLKKVICLFVIESCEVLKVSYKGILANDNIKQISLDNFHTFRNEEINQKITHNVNAILTIFSVHQEEGL